MKRMLPLLLLAACSRDIPQDKLLDILNQRAAGGAYRPRHQGRCAEHCQGHRHRPQL